MDHPEKKREINIKVLIREALDYSIILPREDDRFVGFLNKFPEIIAEGDTEEEIQVNLLISLQAALSYYKKNK